MNKKAPISPPEGFRYQPDVISIDEEQELIEHIHELSLQEYEFHGFAAKRRVIYYGWQYDAKESRLKQTEQIPGFLQKLRQHAASLARLEIEDLALAQVIEYRPGAAIGWHRDRAVFDDV